MFFLDHKYNQLETQERMEDRYICRRTTQQGRDEHQCLCKEKFKNLDKDPEMFFLDPFRDPLKLDINN